MDNVKRIKKYIEVFVDCNEIDEEKFVETVLNEISKNNECYMVDNDYKEECNRLYLKNGKYKIDEGDWKGEYNKNEIKEVLIEIYENWGFCISIVLRS